jgi:hypothetical protein
MQDRMSRLRMVYQKGAPAPVPGRASTSSKALSKSRSTVSLGTPFGPPRANGAALKAKRR